MSDEIVKYSNQFNNQALRKFTALDLDLLMAIASRVRDKGTDEVAFTFEELKRLAGLQRNMTNDEFAKQIANVNRRLLALNFEFQNEEHDIIQFALFAGFVTSPTKRTLTVSVNSRFSFLLNDLTSQFTRFELAEFTALRSSYAKECYRRLKQYRQTGVWKVSLEDFRRLLDVPKSYRPSEINKYVLKPIEEELGPLLNLKVHRKYLKKKPGRGRASLVGFEFEFDPEKVPGGAPAPRVELSGSVVTDEARKSLRDVSKTPVPDLSVPGEGPVSAAHAADTGHKPTSTPATTYSRDVPARTDGVGSAADRSSPCSYGNTTNDSTPPVDTPRRVRLPHGSYPRHRGSRLPAVENTTRNHTLFNPRSKSYNFLVRRTSGIPNQGGKNVTYQAFEDGSGSNDSAGAPVDGSPGGICSRNH